MPAIAGIHAAKVFRKEKEILIQVPFSIRAGQSALTVRRQIVRITVITNVMQTMLISGAAARRIVRKRNVPLLKRHNRRYTGFSEQP